MKKRLLGTLLALCMLITLLPVFMPEVKVEAKKAKGTLNYNTYELKEGTKFKLKLKGAEVASFKSSNKKIAKVNKKGIVTFTYDAKEDCLHRTAAEAPGLEFRYSRAVVGSWQLDKVLKINEGDAPEELAPENAASLYAEKDNILTINADGTGVLAELDGIDTAEVNGTWKTKGADTIVYTQDTFSITTAIIISKDAAEALIL